MSDIFAAFRVLKLEQRDQSECMNLAAGPSLELPDNAAGLSGFEEFTALCALEEQQKMRQAEAQTSAPAGNASDVSTLEERLIHAVEMAKQERREREAAEERAQHAEAEVSEQAPRIIQLEGELTALKSAGECGREGVERLMHLLDSLEHVAR